MSLRPLGVGIGCAILSALAFGLTTPVVERMGGGLGPCTTASLLYLGAGLSALGLMRWTPTPGAPFRREHAGRILVIALVGAGIAPTLLAWGLQRVGAATGSLLLNLEAPFTVVFAWILYGESIDRRVFAALGWMALGGVALTLDTAGGTGWNLPGAAAVVGATVAWALDNTLSATLSAQDPSRVVAAKALPGALLTGAVAVVRAEPLPIGPSAIALLLCGATGYGLSLRLYLLAQRRIGAARTGSIFAVAPFVGAATAWAVGDRTPGPWMIVSTALFAVAVALHLTERHRHRHVHPAVEHDHAHRHDDGHHDHVHEPPIEGEHAHVHHHAWVEHDHEHAPDMHHDHRHDEECRSVSAPTDVTRSQSRDIRCVHRQALHQP